MPDVALVPGQATHQLLMTARDHAAGALMVHRRPVADTLVGSVLKVEMSILDKQSKGIAIDE